MNRSKNKNRHHWVDRGGSTQTYKFDCTKCGLIKILSSGYSASYYDDAGNFISSRAPECFSKEQLKLEVK